MKKQKASDVIEIDDKFINTIAEKIRAKLAENTTKIVDPVNRVYTISQVAYKVGKTEATVRKHIKKGILKACKIGKGDNLPWTVKKNDLEKYLGVEITDNPNTKWK
jgi:hypothetical protein